MKDCLTYVFREYFYCGITEGSVFNLASHRGCECYVSLWSEQKPLFSSVHFRPTFRICNVTFGWWKSTGAKIKKKKKMIMSWSHRREMIKCDHSLSTFCFGSWNGWEPHLVTCCALNLYKCVLTHSCSVSDSRQHVILTLTELLFLWIFIRAKICTEW